ncbi:MAG: hypothetical protein ACI81I_001153 [Arcobacteraceae bacterium]|jgi:hypothetical protein
MFTINIDKECGCFKRSGFENNASFESNDDALIKANSMLTHMNEKFCGKHAFALAEDGNNFQISMVQPAPAAASGCCGGGHCS